MELHRCENRADYLALVNGPALTVRWLLERQLAYRGGQPTQPGPSAITDRVGEVGPCAPHVSGLVDELVVADQRPLHGGRTQVEQGLLGAGGAISGQQPVDVGAVVNGRRVVGMQNHLKPCRQ